jgi:Ser/Thr protein kinase RdoA (MazF antagonist)
MESAQGFIRQAWDADGLLGAHPIWGRFEDLAALTPEAARQLGQARDRARAKLTAFGKNEDRFGLIHADLLPENVLVHEGSPMAIDFDDSGFSWRLYDLATRRSTTPSPRITWKPCGRVGGRGTAGWRRSRMPISPTCPLLLNRTQTP